MSFVYNSTDYTTLSSNGSTLRYKVLALDSSGEPALFDLRNVLFTADTNIDIVPATQEFTNRTRVSGIRGYQGFVAASSATETSENVVTYRGYQGVAGEFSIIVDETDSSYPRNSDYIYATSATRRYYIGGDSSGVARGVFYASGFSETSDIRLKVIKDTNFNANEVLKSLRPVTFNFLGSNSKSMGLIYEEVAKIAPQVCNNGKIAYSRLGLVICKALQERFK